MTVDLTHRLGEIGAALAKRMPGVLDATIALLELVAPTLDATPSARYEIKHQIGAGGQAEVFLGLTRGAYGFSRLVAIKRVRSDLADSRKPAAMMLMEEALQTARFSHPNVVSVLDLDRDSEGRPYLVMEYVDGVNLATLIESGPLPYPVAIFIVRELLSGLGYIHNFQDQGRRRASGLIHRDVTPRNVLLSWTGEIKLADFGLVQMLQRTMTVRAHACEGTIGYMSPEQAHREVLDGRSDLYAVGIVLWEILALRRLRVGSAGDVEATTAFQSIRRPSEYRQDVPTDLEAVAMRFLAYDREERYRTAELAAHDLMCCQDAPRDGRSALVRLLDERFPRPGRQDPRSRTMEPGAPSEGPSTVTDHAEPDGPSPPPPPWPRGQGDGQRCAGILEGTRRRWWTPACVVLSALALATMIWLLVVR